MSKMTFEEIKEFCKKFEDRNWEIDIWKYEDATVVRFYDHKRPLAISVSGIIGNDIWPEYRAKADIVSLYSAFKYQWNNLYFYLQNKHLPELHQ